MAPIDREKFGFAIFNLNAYNSGGGVACTGAPTFCGYQWHSEVSSVPLGGYPPRSLFYQPRMGAAYDLFGNSQTILRGGWGRYYFHIGQFTNGLDASAGVKSTSFDGKVSLSTNNSVFAAIRTLQHRPRLSNRCVGQTLTHEAWHQQLILVAMNNRSKQVF